MQHLRACVLRPYSGDLVLGRADYLRFLQELNEALFLSLPPHSLLVLAGAVPQDGLSFQEFHSRCDGTHSPPRLAPPLPPPPPLPLCRTAPVAVLSCVLFVQSGGQGL